MSEDGDDINNHLRSAMLQIEANSDQALAAFREEYIRLATTERAAYRKWVEQHALTQSLPIAIPMHSRCLIEVHIQQGDDEGITARLSPSLVLKAIGLWDAGKTFRPDGWRDCVSDR